MKHGAATPAVDHAGGIARLMGDGALFARVLVRFRCEYRDSVARIHQALDDGDGALALRLAHTLKGAAGMIEARPLQAAAHALEQALRSRGDPYAGLAQLEQALGQVLRELDVATHALPTGPAAPPARVDAQPHARARLSALLDEGNGDAVDLVRNAEGALRLEMGNAAYDRLAAAIEAFDFDRALAMLKEHAGAA